MSQQRSYLRLARKALLCAGFIIMLLGFNAFEAGAQNTKGDRPTVRPGAKRENRFKSLRKKSKSKPTYNRVRSKRNSAAGSARVARSTKANKNFYGNRNYAANRSSSEKVSRQNTKSRAGRVTPRSTYGSKRNFFSQRGRFVNNRTSERSQRIRNPIVSNRSQVARVKRFQTKQNPATGKRITVVPRSSSRPFIQRRSTTPFARYWNKKPRGEKPYTQGDLAGRPLRMKNFETRKPVLTNPTAKPYRVKPTKSDRIYTGPIRGGYRSATKAGVPWKKGDIAGRKIKGKNFSSKRPPIGGNRIFPPRSSSRDGKSFQGTLPGGGYRSMSGRMNMGGGAKPIRSAGRGSWNNKGRSIAGRNSGANGNLARYSGNIKGRKGYTPQGGGFSGNIKARKREKGGGSISGSWNNDGRAIAGRNSGANGNLARYSGNIKGRKSYSPQGETYSGNIKARKREKGGGSISGSWNNNGRAIAGRNSGANGNIARYSGTIKGRKSYSPQGETYSGNIKARKREKAGGSISGSWNNNGRAIAGRNRGDANVSRYQGNVKFQRKEKGGGSISGSWNNKGQAIAGRYRGDANVSRYQGNVKFQRKPKGGGSISGSWNNNGQAIPGRYAGNSKIAKHRGYRMFELKPSMRDQGEGFTGSIKAKPKPKGAGGSVSGFWNNNEQSTTVRNPGSNKLALFTGKIKVKKDPKKDVDYFPGKHRRFDFQPSMRDQGEAFTGHIKLSRFKRNYLKSPKQADEALKKARPDKTTYLVNGLQIKVKEKDYRKKPNAAEGALLGIAPGRNFVRASQHSRVIRQNWNYRRNPASDNEALKVREPGKAFVRATAYQGNIKMKKFDLFGKKNLYPNAKFVKTNKNNTDEERGLLTNFKLWWARLFKKNEDQPSHLKQKMKKPGYDKGEKGLWYD